jgi:hypothetical protein
MRDFAEIFHAVAFLLQWIIAGTRADDGYLFRFDLKGLFASLRSDQGSLYADSASRTEFADFVKIGEILLEYDLDIFEIRTVVELDESEFLGISDAFYSAVDQVFLVQ